MNKIKKGSLFLLPRKINMLTKNPKSLCPWDSNF